MRKTVAKYNGEGERLTDKYIHWFQMWETFCFSAWFCYLRMMIIDLAAKRILKTIWVRERKHECGVSPKSQPPAHTQLDIAVIWGKSLNGQNYKWNSCWQGEEAQLYLTEVFSFESCFLFFSFFSFLSSRWRLQGFFLFETVHGWFPQGF